MKKFRLLLLLAAVICAGVMMTSCEPDEVDAFVDGFYDGYYGNY